MREFRFNKLVRDKIPEKIISDGGEVISHILNNSEMIEEIKKKIIEEALELSRATSPDEVGEIADLQELIDLLCKLKGISRKDLKTEKGKKVLKAGAFKQRVYIEIASIPDESSWLEYFMSQPEKYPEVK